MIRLWMGMAAAAVVAACLAFGSIADAQEKAKSKCNAITEETACTADATCIWMKALVDAKTGKQKRKAYCKTRSAGKKAKVPGKSKEPGKAKEPGKK